MSSVVEVEAEAGVGLVGDRYASGRGRWSGGRDDPLTLITEEDVAAVSSQLGVPLEAGAMRRNVVTRGVEASTLIGMRFRIGEALLEGVRPCAPCRYLESLVGLPGLKEALHGRGGVRARIVESGTLRVGDSIFLVEG